METMCEEDSLTVRTIMNSAVKRDFKWAFIGAEQGLRGRMHRDTRVC
jgi:hypothetical protein